MDAIELDLPVPWTSNLVFSSDATRVFGLSGHGDVWSAELTDGGAGSPRLERASSGGAVLAVEWFEDRLATLTVGSGEIELSHGTYGENLEPSEPLRARVEATGLVFPQAGTLRPYARWWIDVEPQVSTLGAVSLVVSADESLFLVQPDLPKPWVRELATGVVRLITHANGCTVLYVARMDAAAPGLWSSLTKKPAPSPEYAVFQMDRRGRDALPGLRVRGSPAVRAHFGYPGRDLARHHYLVALTGDASAWSIYRGSTLMREAPELIGECVGNDVAGVLWVAPGEPALVVRSDDDTLSLSSPAGTRALVRASSRISSVAVSHVAPVVAYVTAGGRLGVARTD